MTTLGEVYAGPRDRLRASSLSTLVKCPLLHLEQRSVTESGAAADTGSAAGRAVQLWHEGATLGDAILGMQRESPAKFPKAHLEDAEAIVQGYCADERNYPAAAFHCELEVDVVLPRWPTDTSGEDVHIRGHLDQIRRGEDGRLYVWDLKCGAPDGVDMLHNYAWQLAVYAVGATAKLGEPVFPGGIIRGKGYVTKAGLADPSVASVFYHAPWSLEVAAAMLENVAFHVALIRAGQVLRHPGAHCSWCHLSPSTCSVSA